MWLTIPLTIIGVAGLTIIVIGARRLPHVSKLRSEIVQKERQARIKWRLVEKRLLRKTSSAVTSARKNMGPLWGQIQNLSKKAYDKALEMERRYKEQAIQEKQVSSEGDSPSVKLEREQQVIALVDEANEALKKNEFDIAEKKCVKAITLDSNSIEAYRALGNLYVKQEEWEQAREVLEYLVKLLPADASVHSLLGDVYTHEQIWSLAAASYKLASELDEQNAHYLFEWGRACHELGKKEDAIDCYKQAVDIEPNNPRYLDFLIEMAILGGNKLLAQNTFDQLKKVNPDNQKLDEFKQRIGQLGRRWDNKR